jgi:hypothetical protein
MFNVTNADQLALTGANQDPAVINGRSHERIRSAQRPAANDMPILDQFRRRDQPRAAPWGHRREKDARERVLVAQDDHLRIVCPSAQLARYSAQG